MLATERVAAAFGFGAHASTFGGTPLVSAAALETLKIMVRKRSWNGPGIPGSISRRCPGTAEAAARSHCRRAGQGACCWAFSWMDRPMALVPDCMQKGFLVNCVQGDTLRFVPPLIVEKNEIDALIQCLDEVLTQKCVEIE
jgi:acetylornithine/N-succinyldiaminopimelate aminotransferase